MYQLIALRIQEPPYSLQLTNIAVSGADTADTVEQVDAALAMSGTRVIIIGLSLRNEGLGQQDDADYAAAVGVSYREGIQALVDQIEAGGAQAMIGGVYPFGRYASYDADVLFETDRTLARRAMPNDAPAGSAPQPSPLDPNPPSLPPWVQLAVPVFGLPQPDRRRRRALAWGNERKCGPP